eukprot:EG_transcript_2322
MAKFSSTVNVAGHLDSGSLDLEDEDGYDARDLECYQLCAQEFHALGRVIGRDEPSGLRGCTVSITVLLVALVICASVAAGVTPLVLLSATMDEELHRLSGMVARQVADGVLARIEALVRPGPEMCDRVARAYQRGLLSSHLEGGLETPSVQSTMAFLYDAFLSDGETSLSWLYVGTEFDAFLGFQLVSSNETWLWNRSSARVLAPAAGAPAPLAENTGMEARTAYLALGGAEFDPSVTKGTRAVYYTRQRDWYRAVQAPGVLRVWQGPYVFSDGVTLGMTAARRLYNASGQYFGVVGADMTLAGVAAYLSSDQMRPLPSMTHTLVEAGGWLIGSSVPGALVLDAANGTPARMRATDARQPYVLRSLVAFLQGQHGDNLDSVGPQLIVEKWKESFVYTVALQDSYALRWVYVLHVPVQDFLGHSNQSRELSVAACIVVILAVALLSVGLAWGVSRQLVRLTQDMKGATSLVLDAIDFARYTSHVKELRDIAFEFVKLAKALRSFRKYLPQDQVRFLLDSNLEARVAAIQQDITTLFLDVDNLPSLAQKMGDGELMRLYSDVMTMITATVNVFSGTFDKYIGDTVMVFWNMPRRVADHETKAVEAALACRDLLPKLQRKGWAVEFCAGIATGCCQVGNFGSKSRLNFTAFGDGVNVAAQLRGLCGAYEARLLVASGTQRKLDPQRFLTRLVDRVVLKGKDESCEVHQVLSSLPRASEDTQAYVCAYGRAFQLYGDRRFAEAEAAFQAAAAAGDPTAAVMARRAAVVKRQPDFDGVWKWSEAKD